jgi:hypothetical protein
VVLVDDPAAEMHDWYGRYLYFAPTSSSRCRQTAVPNREESRS